MCVALGSRIGSGLGPNGRELMIAAELVHNATLLHDDVVDLGDVRRGAQTARVIYGNAASIFAGDWLLVEALRRIQASRVPGVLEQVLSVLAQMLAAESLQLACRGSVTADMGTYMRIVEGKTASLFRWALFAGARAGNVSDDACRALEAYGDKLGVAFQIVDDLLDIAGDAAITGKSLLMDLREGKTTYPLILAMEKNAGLGALVSEACATTDANVESALHERIVAAVRACGAVEETKKFARKLSEDATSFLAAVPPCTARDALECIAVELVSRTR